MICLAEPLTETEQAEKETYIEAGFPDWSRRDFQQLIRGLEAYGWLVLVIGHLCRSHCSHRGESFDVYAQDIQDKTAEEVEKYYRTFEKKWKTLSGTPFLQSKKC